jgi:hypothetical protein
MVMTGWVMTIAGCGVVLVWLVLESVSTFASAPVATIIGIVVVLALMALLVPAPLIVATRRANARRQTGSQAMAAARSGGPARWPRPEGTEEAG